MWFPTAGNHGAVKTVRWLLIFPPLVTSNWGGYYPSIAALSAVLRHHGAEPKQIDLNEEFFDYLIDPQRLKARAVLEDSAINSIPTRAALQMVSRGGLCIRDDAGRHFRNDPESDVDLVAELARPFHVDLDVSEVLGLGFAESVIARDYDAFFRASSLTRHLDGDLDAVGISVPMGPQVAPTILLARIIHNLRKDVKIVLGGPSMTLMGDNDLAKILVQGDSVSAVVRFEGEQSIIGLTEQLATGQWAPAKVSGVVSLIGADRVLTVPPIRARSLPFADFDQTLIERLAHPRLSVLQARGCYWGRCAYCDFVELYSGTTRYDGRRGESVLEEVEHLLRRFDISDFWLITEALPPKIGLEFARGLIQRGLSVDWRSFAMIDRGFTSEVLETYVASGCTGLTIGLETQIDRVLRLVEKRASGKDNLKFLSACRTAGLKIDLNLIPNLPTSTYVEALEALEQLKPFADVFRTVAVFPFEATASSAIGRHPERYGMQVIGRGGSDGQPFPKGQAQFCSNRLICRDGGMSDQELESAVNLYNQFATEVLQANRPKVPAKGVGLAFRSRRVGILPSEQETIVYEWDTDSAWRYPAAAYPLLSWMHRLDRPVSRGEVATWLARRYGTDCVAAVCREVCDRLVCQGLVDYLH